MLLQGKIDFIPVDKLGFAAVEDGASYADVSKIPLEGAVIYGKKKAKYKIIVFDDPDCPFCRKLQTEVEKVIKKRKDVVFYKLLYPLPIHPKAYDKAKAIVCEKSEKKSRKLLKDAFEGKKLPKPDCETDIVDDTIALAAKLGINGTPGIIMPDGLIISGYREADAIIAILDRTEERIKTRQAAGKEKDFVKPAPRAKPASKYADLSEIPLADAVLMGKKGAKNRVIVFDDPDCPFCRKLHVEIKKILEEREDINFFIKMYPLPMHPQAMGKSKAIVCEKSLKLLDDAFAGKQLPAATCETTVVDETIALAARLGIRGTPAIIMPDGFIVSGYLPAPQLLKMIDGSEDRKKARKAAGE
jgi:protein-disulfide isomerase